MAEWPITDGDLDAFIEAALRDEPLAPVPHTLHARITERVALAALEHKARARFRKILLSGFLAGTGIVATTAALLAVTNFHLLLDHGISGGLGQLDYYAATFRLQWPGRLDGIYLLPSLALGAFTVWAGLRCLYAPGGRARGGSVAYGRILRTR